MTDSDGSSHQRRRADRLIPPLAAILVSLAIPAQAKPRRIAIPATTLDLALGSLARQSGADIISTEPGLSRIRTRPVRDARTPADALARLLAGSGYRAIAVDARSFRIVRGASPAPRVARTTPAPPAGDIVVTASKQRVPLLRYPGSVATIDPQQWPVAIPAPNLTDVARTTPVLQSTALGPGRNKIFIRGIADSSFAGAAQSTASVYLGDVQLGYSGPDPALRLYDMAGVQVMEGPQGTLYGSGSIGGVIRLLPNPVRLGETTASVSGGASATVNGAPGYDMGAMVNLPVAGDRLGLRLVGYHERDGGFVDDLRRHLRDVNRIDTTGARAALRFDPGGGWRIDATALAQHIGARDASYAQASAGPLARRSALAQPFENSIALGSVVVTRDWGDGYQLLSATGVSHYRADDVFDATPPGAATPIAYTTVGEKLLLSQEARLSRSLAGGTSWVAGFALLRDRDAQSRTVGTPAMPTDIIGVTNVTRSASAFAEATLAITPAFAATLGARGTLARTDGEPSFRPRGAFVEGRSTRRVDPTAAFSWKLAPHLAAFGRYQSGYRTGGLAVARGVGRVADFRSDSIRMGEIGIRKLRAGETGLAASAAVSVAKWRDIQADLVNRFGAPYTANIGDARIVTVEGNADWVPIPGLRATAAFLHTANRVTGALANLTTPSRRRLPQTPPFAAKGDVAYDWAIGGGMRLDVGASVTRVGRSVLGIGDLLDIAQGRYTTLGARIGWTRGRYAATLSGENLTDARGNMFAGGNQFALASRNLTTPPRPLTVRLGGSVTW